MLHREGRYLFSRRSAARIGCNPCTPSSPLYPRSFIELPTHHCPFCILQQEYGYIGYPLYLTLMTGRCPALGRFTLPFRHIASLRHALPPLQRRLALATIIFFCVFTALSAYGILASNLSLKGL